MKALIPAAPFWTAARGRELPEACVLRNVALALDDDDCGDGCAERLRDLLTPVGARMVHWRPEAKDWNDDLRAIGLRRSEQG